MRNVLGALRVRVNRIKQFYLWIIVEPDIVDADAIDCRVKFGHKIVSGFRSPERKERMSWADLLRAEKKFRLSVALDDRAILVKQ